MLKRSIIPLTFFLILSCGQKSGNPDQPGDADISLSDTVTLVTVAGKQLFQANSFNEIDSSGILMFPLSFIEKEDRSYGKKEVSGHWNVVFYNSNTGEAHLLSEDKLVIRGIENNYNSEDGGQDTKISRDVIFYRVVADDYNQNKTLDYNDPEYLYLSDKQGRNFRRMSPPGMNLVSWSLVKASGKLVMALTKDSNNDKKFNDADEVIPFVIDLQNDSIAAEALSPEFRNKVKMKHLKQWRQPADR